MSAQEVAGLIEARAAATVAAVKAGTALPNNFLTAQLRQGQSLGQLYIPTETGGKAPRQDDNAISSRPSIHALLAKLSNDEQYASGSSKGRAGHFPKIVPGHGASASETVEAALQEARLRRAMAQTVTAAAACAEPPSSSAATATELTKSDLLELNVRINELGTLDGRLNDSLGQLSLSPSLQDYGTASRSPAGSFTTKRTSGSATQQNDSGSFTKGSTSGSLATKVAPLQEESAPTVVLPSEVESFAELRREEQRWRDEELAYTPRSRSWLLPPGTSLKSLFVRPEC